MFDPFGDFPTAGYLRNIECLKDLDMVKVQEQVFFEANLEDALRFLHDSSEPRGTRTSSTCIAFCSKIFILGRDRIGMHSG